MRVAVEVCVSTLDQARAALAAGADRVELCAWPTCGGVTPPMGLLRAAVREAWPCRVLIRPGPGGFQYTPEELRMGLDEVTVCRDLGLQAVVVGALDASGRVDHAFVGKLRTAFPEAEITFHRAIDHCPDPLAALEVLAEVGVQRVLTSGGAPTALEGANTIARMAKRVGTLTIAVAGGVVPGNVVEVVERTGAREVHFAAYRPAAAKGIAMSTVTPDADRALLPDAAKIEGVLNALTKAGLR